MVSVISFSQLKDKKKGREKRERELTKKPIPQSKPGTGAADIVVTT